MKNLNKLAAILCSVVLCASIAFAPVAAFAADGDGSGIADQLNAAANGNGTSSDSSEASGESAGEPADQQATETNLDYVIDEDGVLSAGDVTKYNLAAQKLAATYNVGVYYFTTKDLAGHSKAEDYADAIVSHFGLDAKTSQGCVVFLLCVNEGEYALCSYGKTSSSSGAFSNQQLDKLNNDVFPYLGRADWSGSMTTYFGDAEQMLKGGDPNATSDVKYNGTYVTDNYGVFSDEQRATLEAKATELAQKYNMGVYLLVVDKMNGLDSPSQAERTNFATSFYRANHLGLGKDQDGVMFALAIDSRDYVTIAKGQGSYSFSDEGIAAMEDDARSYLGDNEWYEGCKAYYDRIGEQLEYFAAKGEPWKEPDPFSLVLKLLAMLGIPAGIAGSVVSGDKRAMKTAREKSEASNYLEQGSFELTQSYDQFVNTTLAVTPIPKNEDKGGDSGFGGGGWGGGGGGGFSSSGGGKF